MSIVTVFELSSMTTEKLIEQHFVRPVRFALLAQLQGP